MGDVFDDMSDINPFADPSVIAASRVTAQQTATAQVQRETAPMGTTWQDQSESLSGNRAGISAELEEFKRREEELRRREIELNMRESRVTDARGNLYKPPNFPPFPSWMAPLAPCFYINIEEEISPQNVPLCKLIFWKLCSYSIILIVNILAMTMVLIAGTDGSTLSFVMSIIVCCLLVPLSFLFSFRSAYVAFKSNSSFYYVLFFISYLCEIIMHLVQFLGFKSSAWAGFIIGATLIDKDHKFAGAICILMGFAFLGLFISSIYIIQSVRIAYRLSGGNLKQAQNEFSAGVWKQTSSSFLNTTFPNTAMGIP